GLTGGAAIFAMLVVVLLAYKLVEQAWPAISKYGLGFLWSRAWDPVRSQFGALDFIFGTFYTSFFALLIAAPLSIAIALFLSELAPRFVRGIVGTLVEMLAAIPSVVIGLWGVFVLGPVLTNHVNPFLGRTLGIHLSLFQGGDTLASRIAGQYQGAVSNLHIASLVYLAVILLAISLVVNLAAQLIVRRFEFQRTRGS